MKNFVLDACALIAFLADEEGAEKVEYILRKAETDDCLIYMNKINILEIYYLVYREEGKEKAEKTLEKILALPIIVIEKLEDDVFKEAGGLKATYKMSLADSVALAEAKTKNAEILTSDHHEFDLVEKKEEIKFYWIR